MPDNLHFCQHYRGDLRFESLLVNAINIALLRAAKLRLYWKRAFFMITSPILSLSSAPQENRYWKANFQLACASWTFQLYTEHCRRFAYGVERRSVFVFLFVFVWYHCQHGL
jgi:hypothetical protein